MSEHTEIGRVAPRAGPRSQRSGTPESRSQLEELRSGEEGPMKGSFYVP